MELSDLATMPLRIEIESRAQWQEGDGDIRMVSAASIYRLPRGKEKPLLLLGPVGVPGKPDASWSELLRRIADALEAEVETSQTSAGAVPPVAAPTGQHPAPGGADSTVPACLGRTS